MRLEEGSVFAGYEIRGVVGRGAMGVVYLGWDPKLDREVALKVVSEHLADDPAFRERFAREAKAAARVDHPGVVTIYQTGEEAGVPFIAMKYVRGTDLETVLAEQGKFDTGRALELLGPVADGLDAAHRVGVVHRDVKPANILVPDDGSSPVLVDFGIGKVAQATRATNTGSWVGTVDYVAPEQIRGGEIDGRSDQYSLACVLFEMVSGAPPFVRDDAIQSMFAHANDQPAPIATTEPESDAALNDALGRALAKDPSDRFVSCGDLVRAAQGAVASPAIGTGSTGTVIGAVPAAGVGPTGTVVGGAPNAGTPSPVSGPSSEGPVAKPPRRRTPVLIGIAVLVVIAVGGTAYAVLGGKAISVVEAEPVASPPVPACEESLSKIRAAVAQAATVAPAKNVVSGTAPYNGLAIVGNRTAAAMTALRECTASDPSASGAGKVKAALQRLMNAKNKAISHTERTRVVPAPTSADGAWYVPDDPDYDEITSGSKPCSAYATVEVAGWDGLEYYDDLNYSPMPDLLRPPTGWRWGEQWCRAIRDEISPPEQVIAVYKTDLITAKAATRVRQAGKAVETLLQSDGLLAPSPS